MYIAYGKIYTSTPMQWNLDITDLFYPNPSKATFSYYEYHYNSQDGRCFVAL